MQYAQQPPYGVPPGFPMAASPPIPGANGYGAEALPTRPMVPPHQLNPHQTSQVQADPLNSYSAPSQDPRLNRAPLPVSKSVTMETTDRAPEPTKDTPDATVKKSKKESTRGAKLVYNDESMSPEEKMAQLSRYAFDHRAQRHQPGLESAIQPSVTGPALGENDVMDAAG